MKLVLLLVTLGMATILAEDTQNLTTFSDEYHKFTSNIYKAAILKSGWNFAICPTPLNHILAVIYAGAKGSSAENIANLLHIRESRKVIRQNFNDIARKLNREANLNYGSINKIYIHDGFQISNTYEKTIVDIFKGDIENIDFEQRQKAVETVNSWVYEKSNQLINQTISTDNLHERSTMLMVSTMNVRGLFANNLFKDNATIKSDFNFGGIASVKTDMMEVFCNNCSYYESKELHAKFLKLNFTNIADGSITFVLPNNIADFQALTFKYDKVLAKPNYSNQYVHIHIPRFKINIEPWVGKDFRNFGLWKDYSDTANFTVIGANQEPLKINYIGQNIVVEVNENGAGATLATHSVLDSIHPARVGVTSKSPDSDRSGLAILDFDDDSVQPEQKIFRAHHSFLFYITLNDTIAVVGLIRKPEGGDKNQRSNILVNSLEKIETKTRMGNRNTSTEKPMTSIVEEYTCPCSLN